MRFFSKISLLLLFVLSGSVGVSSAIPKAHTSGKIAQAEKSESRATHPFNRPNLFNIFHQAEEPGNSLNNVPAPLLVVDEEDQSRAYHRALLGRELKEQVWLKIFERPNRTFIRLTFIFPFHSFL